VQAPVKRHAKTLRFVVRDSAIAMNFLARELLFPLWSAPKHALVGGGIVLTLVVASAVTIAIPTQAEVLHSYIVDNAQTVTVSATAALHPIARESFSATPGIATLAASGTNHDWATLVLIDAGFPVTDNNVMVLTRWMRQENGTNNWWNRNNPLNNGWGSGGGGGTGSYDSLIIAAEYAAKALHGNPGYASIVASFSTSTETAAIEDAIWASPWASGHYSYGAHWSYVDVPVVKAPAGTW
jgi:hypothetical protein